MAEAAPKKARKKRKNFLYNVGMRWRIFIYLLGFALIMVLLLWLFQIVYLDNFYEYIKKDQIETAGSAIVTELDDEDLQSRVEEVAQRYNMCAEVYELDSANGLFFGSELVASVEVIGDCIIHHISERETNQFYYKAMNAGSDGYTVIYSRDMFGRQVQKDAPPSKTDERLSPSLVYARVAQNADGHQYLILLNSSIAPVYATVATLRVQLIVISVILIIMALVISFLIARRLSDPISSLNKAAQHLGRGDLQVEFPAKGYKEIAQLADSLNYAGSELARTDKLQRDLVANISHDIRTPLTMIGGYAEYMQDFPDEDHSESVRVIMEEAERLRDLVNDILDNSRLTSGATTIERKDFDLSASLANFVGNYALLVEPKGYLVELDADEDVWVNGDEKRLLQAVSNFMNNAAAHIGADKKILVSLKVRRPGSEGGRLRFRSDQRKLVKKPPVARLAVTDHGCGISANDLAYIWDRYYHADAPAAGTHGSGLGLSIVRGIMELHGAKYGVDSRPGEGSTVWFELPLAEKNAD